MLSLAVGRTSFFLRRRFPNATAPLFGATLSVSSKRTPIGPVQGDKDVILRKAKQAAGCARETAFLFRAIRPLAGVD
jgi:hypothetical protein